MPQPCFASTSTITTITDRTAHLARPLPDDHSPTARQPRPATSDDTIDSVDYSTSISRSNKECSVSGTDTPTWPNCWAPSPTPTSATCSPCMTSGLTTYRSPDVIGGQPNPADESHAGTHLTQVRRYRTIDPYSVADVRCSHGQGEGERPNGSRAPLGAHYWNAMYPLRSHQADVAAVSWAARDRCLRLRLRRRSEYVGVPDPDCALVLDHAQRGWRRAPVARSVGVVQLDVVEGLMHHARRAVRSLETEPARPASRTSMGKEVRSILHVHHSATAVRQLGSNTAHS